MHQFEVHFDNNIYFLYSLHLEKSTTTSINLVSLPDSKQYCPLAFISTVLQLSLGSVEGGSNSVAPIFNIFSCPPK